MHVELSWMNSFFFGKDNFCVWSLTKMYRKIWRGWKRWLFLIKCRNRKLQILGIWHHLNIYWLDRNMNISFWKTKANLLLYFSRNFFFFFFPPSWFFTTWAGIIGGLKFWWSQQFVPVSLCLEYDHVNFMKVRVIVLKGKKTTSLHVTILLILIQRSDRS